MATGPQFIEALAPVCGIHPATLDRYMRELRGAGLIPAGGRGGGIAAAHLNHEHAAIIILSLAATSPAGAVAAYETVKNLDRDNVQAGDFAGLGFTLAMTIRSTASSIYARLLAGQEPRALSDQDKWELTICLEPVTVWQSWIIDGTERREGFSDRQSLLPRPAHPQDVHRGIRRQTIITSSVLNVAAELCADTMQHEAIKTKAITPAERLAAANAVLSLRNRERRRKRHEYLTAQSGQQAAIFDEYDALVANANQEAGQSADTQSQPGLPVSTPQNKTAESPARDAAAVCDQTVQTDVVGSLQPHRKRVRESSQAQNAQAGHSFTPDRNLTDEPDRYGGLNFAPA